MDRSRFDDLTRTLAGRASRRSVTAGLAAAVLGVAGVRGAGAQTGCPQGQVNRRGIGCVCRASGRPPVSGRCPSPPCGTYIVAGADGPLSPVNADDDFAISVSGVPVIVDDNGVHSDGGPSAPFSAALGDPIRITATNDNGGCQGITPVVLYCATDPTISQVLTNGVPNPFPSGCIHDPSTTPFFDVTVAIAI